MKIEVDLEDKKSCVGCPLFPEGLIHIRGYYVDCTDRKLYIAKANDDNCSNPSDRPQACIDKYGE